jgi:hypothetical protein
MRALHVDLNSIRPNPIGIELNPIGIEKQAQKIEPYLCVGMAPPTPPAKHQKPIDSLHELWALVGCKVSSVRADRRHKARAAQQAAIARHTRKTPTASSATDTNDTRVVRDEHAHDLSAWD